MVDTTSIPNNDARSPKTFPYFFCSVSASTIKPPPASTKASIAASSSGVWTGDPTPVVVSHSSSEQCGITSTSISASASGVNRPSSWARTS
ncbi:MAG: hypothetical protein V9G09_02855 [Candidatus Nanopelagicales bacterium]